MTKHQAHRNGLQLTVDLAKDTLAVKTQAFQAALLTVVNGAFNTKLSALSNAEYNQLAQAVLELGRMYARLTPTQDLASSTNWLDKLWQATQTGSERQFIKW